PRHLHSFLTRRSSDLALARQAIDVRAAVGAVAERTALERGERLELDDDDVRPAGGLREELARARERERLRVVAVDAGVAHGQARSEEHTSELQSPYDL